jgi:hypothetical protein
MARDGRSAECDDARSQNPIQLSIRRRTPLFSHHRSLRVRAVPADKTNKFIKEWVLCPRCKLPETSMEIGKKKDIIFDCKACGYHGQADMMHKLATFILNNPPDSKGGIQDKAQAGKKTKEDRKREKAEKRTKGDDDDDADDNDDDKKDDGDKEPVDIGDGDDGDDGDWSMDTSAAAVKAREDQAQASFDKIEAAMSDTKLSDAKEGKEGKEGKKKKKKKGDDDDDDDPFGDKAEIEAARKAIGAEVQAACEKSAAGEVDGAIKALMVTYEKHGLSHDDLLGFIFESAFDEDAIKQVKTHHKLLTKLLKASPDKKKSGKFLCVLASPARDPEPAHTQAVLPAQHTLRVVAPARASCSLVAVLLGGESRGAGRAQLCRRAHARAHDQALAVHREPRRR